MTLSNLYKSIKRRWDIFLLVVIAATVIAFIGSIAQTPKYGSTVQFLVVQSQNYSVDALSASRSAELVAGSMTKIIHTTSFMDKVLAAKFNVTDDFGTDPTKRHKAWVKTVNVEADGSLLEIQVLSENRSQAESIAQAVTYVLENESAEYHGGGENISFRTVNRPTTTDKPVYPNVPLNTLAGFVIGVILGVGGAYLSYNPQNEKAAELPAELSIEHQ